MVERALLRPGYSCSRILKGGWQLAGGHGRVNQAEAIRDMAAFADAGITSFDCADIYTGVEELIGAFIAQLRRDRGAEAAEVVEVHTKLVPDLARLPDLRPEEIEAIIDRSLRRLRVDRLHLVQCFWWDMTLGRPVELLSTLQELQAKGKIAHLGCTNWDTDTMTRLIGAGLDLATAQVQYSILDQRPAGRVAQWCGTHDMQILAYGTLAGGFLTESWLGAPEPGHSFENRSLIKYRLIIDEFGGWALFQELMQTLAALSRKHGSHIGAVASAWVLDQPVVAGVIIGARTARHLPRTLEIDELRLEPEDHLALDAILARRKGPSGPVYGLERDRNGPHGRIMKYDLNAPAA